MQLCPDVVAIGLGWENLFNISNAFVLHLECMVDSLEGHFDDVLDVGPLRIRL